MAALLAHLAEVEARGIHRTRRCASLYTYCIYELRFSEDAAARRSAAARLVKEFPLLFDAIAEGELHLTDLLMIGPHLTLENHVEVLGRAKFRTKKELSKLVRELHPPPRIPDRIEPLGPAPQRALRNPTWEEYVTSLAPRIRELPEGERPRDWTSGSDIARGSGSDAPDRWTQTEPLPVGPVPQDLPPVNGPLHYHVQFSTIEEHAQLVERAKALLARERPGVTLGELHLEAMRLLVASLEKRKFAVSDRPRGSVNAPRRRGETKQRNASVDRAPRQRSEARPPSEVVGATRPAGSELAEPARHDQVEPGQRGETKPSQRRKAGPSQCSETKPRQRGKHSESTFADGEAGSEPHQCDEQAERESLESATASAPRRRGDTDRNGKRSRYIPATERRVVYQRDEGRCTYVDARGERCCETRYLELHHLQPFALQGANVAVNLTLRCRAHNALAAEEDFGQRLVTERRESTRHEAFARQLLLRGAAED